MLLRFFFWMEVATMKIWELGAMRSHFLMDMKIFVLFCGSTKILILKGAFGQTDVILMSLL